MSLQVVTPPRESYIQKHEIQGNFESFNTLGGDAIVVAGISAAGFGASRGVIPTSASREDTSSRVSATVGLWEMVGCKREAIVF